jgi:hypothetical protein
MIAAGPSQSRWVCDAKRVRLPERLNNESTSLPAISLRWRETLENVIATSQSSVTTLDSETRESAPGQPRKAPVNDCKIPIEMRSNPFVTSQRQFQLLPKSPDIAEAVRSSATVKGDDAAVSQA